MELVGVSASVPFGRNVTDVAAVLPLPMEVDPEAGCVPIAGESPVVRALGALLHRIAAERVVVAVAEPARAALASALAGGPMAAVAVLGVDASFDWRQTVRAGLEHPAVQPFSSVVVHDWRHPLAPAEVTDRVVAALVSRHRVVVPVTAVTDSVKEVDGDGAVIATIDRTTLRNIQYPRGFAVQTLADLFTRGADPVAAAFAAGESVTTVDGHPDAGRFTLPADAALLEAIITTRS